MNKQTVGAGIEWCHVPGYIGATANPVRGCKHECQWRMPDGDIATCYAKVMAERIRNMRTTAGRPYEHGFEHITFHPEEITKIARNKNPHAIFIDSMSDLFGQGVEDDQINQVIECARRNPQHLFMSLTKAAPRMKKFSPFPDNWWLGISAPPTFMYGKELTHGQQLAFMRTAMQALSECDAVVRWLSLEPLSFDISLIVEQFPHAFDWAVVGAASNGAATYQPNEKHFSNILWTLDGNYRRAVGDAWQPAYDKKRKKKVFFKGNIDAELAKCYGGWREEFPI